MVLRFPSEEIPQFLIVWVKDLSGSVRLIVLHAHAGQLNDMELENQGLQAQLADATTKMQNASAAHTEAAASAAALQESLEEAQKGAAAASAELSACFSKVQFSGPKTTQSWRSTVLKLS